MHNVGVAIYCGCGYIHNVGVATYCGCGYIHNVGVAIYCGCGYIHNVGVATYCGCGYIRWAWLHNPCNEHALSKTLAKQFKIYPQLAST